MWAQEHSVETTAPPGAVWRLYQDVTTWPDWNGAVDKVELDGPFAAGTTGLLTPSGQTPVPFRVVSAAENEGYVSETDIADTVTLRITATLTPVPAGTRITHEARLTGPAADHFGDSFGPILAAGVPATLRGLAARAEQEARDGG